MVDQKDPRVGCTKEEMKSRIEKDNSILRSKLTFQRIFAKKRKDVFFILCLC